MGENLYIVLSQTGTMLSRVLHWITKAEYNHVSISLSKDIEPMYSFGRRHPYNPIWGGFVKESKYAGTFKRFKKTDALVMEVPVTKEQYRDVKQYIDNMYAQKEMYKYNTTGLFLGALHMDYHPQNAYYCSSFVKEVLYENGILGMEDCVPIMQPAHFYELFSKYEIYKGKLQKYNET